MIESAGYRKLIAAELRNAAQIIRDLAERILCRRNESEAAATDYYMWDLRRRLAASVDAVCKHAELSHFLPPEIRELVQQEAGGIENRIQINCCGGCRYAFLRAEVLLESSEQPFSDEFIDDTQQRFPRVNVRDVLQAITPNFLQAAGDIAESLELLAVACDSRLPLDGSKINVSSTKTKRSSSPGSAQLKLGAALARHHQYDTGSCLNPEPIALNGLRRLAGDVGAQPASQFFKTWFGCHEQYKARCHRDIAAVASTLKAIMRDFQPADFQTSEDGDELDRADSLDRKYDK